MTAKRYTQYGSFIVERHPRTRAWHVLQYCGRGRSGRNQYGAMPDEYPSRAAAVAAAKHLAAAMTSMKADLTRSLNVHA